MSTSNVHDQGPQLVGQSKVLYDPALKETSISQKAEIGGKVVTITLNFAGAISTDAANASMRQTLDKAAKYAQAFQLGEKNAKQETTLALTLTKEEKVERLFTDRLGKTSTVTHTKEATDQLIAAIARPILSPPSTISVPLAAIPPPMAANSPPTQPVDNSIDIEITSLESYAQAASSQPTLHAPMAESPPIHHAIFADKDKGIRIQEQAERVETVPLLLKGLTSKADAFQKRLDQMSGKEHTEEYKKLNEHLVNTRAQITLYTKNLGTATWGSTNSPRFAFQALGKEGAKEGYAPVLCNLRMQTVMDVSGKPNDSGNILPELSRMSRSAAISDFSHGEISLHELKQLEGTNLTAKDKCNLKLKALISYGADALVKKQATKETPTLGLDLLILLNEKNKSKWIINQKDLSKEDMAILDKIEIDPALLNKVVGKRQDHLEQLVLQDLYTHFKTAPVAQEQTIYARTSLLDVAKKGKEEFGCILHERTQALDMRAILNQLEGKDVAFDVTESGGPFIDEKGVIHMPKECALGETKETKLRTVFLNIAVQGNTKNSGLQAEINEEGLKKLQQLCLGTSNNNTQKQLAGLSAGLQKLKRGESDPFEAALQATRCLMSLGAYTGANCYGGKDRTGYLLALVTHSFLKETGADPETLKKWGHELVKEGGVGSEISKENADHTTLKVQRYELELYDTKSIRGKMLRVANLLDAARLGISALFKLSTSETPGQLYKEKADELKGRVKVNKSSPAKKPRFVQPRKTAAL